jgi:hypothetical protein
MTSTTMNSLKKIQEYGDALASIFEISKVGFSLVIASQLV